MAFTEYRILRFSEHGPEYLSFDGQALHPAPEPREASRVPVLALLPDSLLFYHLPRALPTGSERERRAAVMLQMDHVFPHIKKPRQDEAAKPSKKGADDTQTEGAAAHAAPVQERGTVKTPEGALVGYFTHPALAAFWREHKELLSRASVVTSPFFLALTAAEAKGHKDWAYVSHAANGPHMLVAKSILAYVRGSEDKLTERAREALRENEHADGDLPLLHLESVLAAIDQAGVKPVKLRLPLTSFDESEDADPRTWARVLVAIGLVGLFFCAGQFMRWRAQAANANIWESAVSSAYGEVLGADPGADPYGKLLFRLDQLKGSQTRGVPIMRLLGLLTEASPPGFLVENISISGDTGSLRARIATYNDLDAMLSRLSESPSFSFTLEQASNTPEGVLANLKVTLR